MRHLLQAWVLLQQTAWCGHVSCWDKAELDIAAGGGVQAAPLSICYAHSGSVHIPGGIGLVSVPPLVSAGDMKPQKLRNQHWG